MDFIAEIRNLTRICLTLGALGLNYAAHASIEPNDPFYPHQWALNHEEKYLSGDNWDIAANQAWELQKTAENIIVAVLDTGVDYSHEDLAANMWVNEVELNGQDFVDDDNNGCVDDIYGCDIRAGVKEKVGYYPGVGGAYYRNERYMYADDMGHGTMVAGVIGAVGNNGVGISGVSWKVKIMSVKLIYPHNVASMQDAATAIRYAVDNGAHIINASFGKFRVEQQARDQLIAAIDYADQHGVLIIASAGNNGVDIDAGRPFYPAGLNAPNLITVTAIDQMNQLWGSANTGASSVDLAAPGVSIYTTVPVGQPTLFRKYYDPSGYMSTEGTSVAAPYVTGVATLLLSHYPGINHLKVKEIILNSVDPVPELSRLTVSGGRVNLYNALTLGYSQ